MSESNAKPMHSSSPRQKPSSVNTRQEKAWRKQKHNHFRRGLDGNRGNITVGDMEELKGYIELGFGFDETKIDPKITKTFPALETLIYGVNKQTEDNKLNNFVEASGSKERAKLSSDEKPTFFIDADDDPETVKAKIKLWAKVVACLVHQYTPRK